MSATVQLEGLLLTADAQVLCTMNQVLDNFGIQTEVFTEAGSALEAVSERKLDTVILDWDALRDSDQVLTSLRKSGPNSRSTVVAIVDGTPDMQAAARMGANFMIYKPTTYKQLTHCFRAVYGTMLLQRRRAVRFPVDIPVVATVTGGGQVEAKVTDLSVGGLALQSAQALQVGWNVSLGFRLPGTTDLIHVTGKVVNTDGKHRAGLCFTFIPAKELAILEKWLDLQLTTWADAGIQVSDHPSGSKDVRGN